MNWWSYLLGAIIAGPVMWGLHRLDKNNNKQHDENNRVLLRIEKKMDKLDDRLHDHISWHGHQVVPKPARKRVKHEV